MRTYFGILRAGALAVPLNFRFNATQIKYCNDIAQPKIFIYGDEFTDRIQEILGQMPNLKHYILYGGNKPMPKNVEYLTDILAKSSTTLPNVPIAMDDESAIYFTSGTTGAPKATLLTHRCMENIAIVENYAHREQPTDNFLLMQPLYHTGGKMHWFGSLIAGARCTVLIGDKPTPKLIFESVQEEKITIMMLLVPWIQDMVTALDAGELKVGSYDLTSWRLMHSGSQPCPIDLLRRWMEYFPKIEYETHYGLSESGGPCLHLLTSNINKLGSIGKPILNWDARIVDDAGKNVAIGQAGELILKGDGIMKGYYKNPKKTAEAIIDGWLHTGDLVKMDADGFITYIDRKKDIINCGGEKIFPFEIENVMGGMNKLKDCAVIGLPNKRLGEIAAIVCEVKDGCIVSEEEVKEYFKPILPKYQWPRVIIFDKIPRNPAGKIEKPKLREKYAKLQL